MVFVDSMLPRQPLVFLWILVAILLIQGNVYGWNFPKKEMKIMLPVDFPLLKIFYKIPVLPEVTENNLDIVLDIGKSKTYLQAPNLSTSVQETLLKMDQKNGTVWLIKRANDTKAFKEYPNGSIVSNITVIGRKKGSKLKRDKRISFLILEFTESMETFCSPSLTSCFPSQNIGYKISELTADGAVLDFLQNLAYSNLCPENKIEYDLTSEYDLVKINRSTGALISSYQPDAEKLPPSFYFTLSCFMLNQTYLTTGSVDIIDVNDNAPTFQFGNNTKHLILNLEPGQRKATFDVRVVDRDSTEVNDLAVRIEGDSLDLFTKGRSDIYGTLDKSKEETFFNVVIRSKRPIEFPGEEYNFKVVIEDTSLLQENRTVTYYVSLIKSSPSYFEKIYNVSVSNISALHSRILQLSSSSFHYKFELDEVPNDWLGITNNSGILYIKDTSMLPSKPQRRNILWFAENETAFEKNTIILDVTIKSDKENNCVPKIEDLDPTSTWCAQQKTRKSCIRSCGPGSPIGHCSWRSGSLVKDHPHSEYATCSPDFSFCPNGLCDELEKLYPSLCPQDCAEKFTGEAVRDGSAKGSFLGAGTCFCASTSVCNCFRHYVPAEMRVGGPKTPSPTTEASNSTVSVENVLIVSNTETKENVSKTGIWSSMRCDDVTCITSLTVGVSLFFLLCASLVVYRIMSSGRKSDHKFVSTFSISGVPSDYVEERSNSRQEAARNTPTEISTFGKSTIDPKWEFQRNRLQFQSILGEGEFGRVLKAQAWNIRGVKGFSTVAVKMVKENAGSQEKQDLMTEYTLLKEISHPNIIKLLGVCPEKMEPFLLIVEFAEIGSLRCYLRRRRKHNTCKYDPQPYVSSVQAQSRDYYQYPCVRSVSDPNHEYFHKEQLSFAWQVAKGMTHLSHMKLVHRDLATRNILLTKQKVVKISDFGLSRDIYEGDAYLKKSRGRVPVKWMAIESLEDQIFTTRSDVWSYGVVLWEIMMLGATPYPGVTPQRLYNLLKAGYRMSKPDYCSDEMYQIMRQCWRTSPRERPSFKDLVLKMDFLLQDTVEYMDFNLKKYYHNARGSDVLPQNDVTPSIQYTSVFVGEDEEQRNTQENEDISLESLFDMTENSGTALLGEISQ